MEDEIATYLDSEGDVDHDKIRHDLDAMLDNVQLRDVLIMLGEICAKQSKALGECAKGRE